MLARERLTWDAERSRWRIFLRTEKTGSPVFLPIPDALKTALDELPHPRGVESEPRYYFWNGITSERAIKEVLRSVLSLRCLKNQRCRGLTLIAFGTR